MHLCTFSGFSLYITEEIKKISRLTVTINMVLRFINGVDRDNRCGCETPVMMDTMEQKIVDERENV